MDARNAIAVIGITGPDDPARRVYIRQAWETSQPHRIALRFAISGRDEAVVSNAETDVHRLDCLGQSSGLAVVEISLIDAWYRFAASTYRHVPFLGRADTDVVVAPAWLDLVLQQLLTRQAGNQSLYYIGRIGWTSWHEQEYRPVGFGYSPRVAAKAAYWGEGRCAMGGDACSPAYVFVRGPFILLSTELMLWYASSHLLRRTLAAAVDSRLDRSVGLGSVTSSPPDEASSAASPSPRLTVEQARRRGVYRRPTHAGDLSVRLSEDSFLGWALCKDGPLNVTVLQLPHHAVVDAPGPCNKPFSPRKSPHLASCCLALLNATRATLVHELKASPWLMPAVATQIAANAPVMPSARCGMMRARVSGGAQLACGRSWSWCTLQRKPEVWMNRAAPRRGSACSAGPGEM